MSREAGATVVGIERKTGYLIFEDKDGTYTTRDTLASFGYGNLTDAEQDLVIRLEEEPCRQP